MSKVSGGIPKEKLLAAIKEVYLEKHDVTISDMEAEIVLEVMAIQQKYEDYTQEIQDSLKVRVAEKTNRLIVQFVSSNPDLQELFSERKKGGANE